MTTIDDPGFRQQFFSRTALFGIMKTSRILPDDRPRDSGFRLAPHSKTPWMA
ncbi:MAG: hypothetical protein QM696_13005 [Steroidobacteraceae bacterium]